jgi:hypothetical protein
VVFYPTHCNRYELHVTAPRPVCMHVHNHLQHLHIHVLCIIPIRLSPVLPCMLQLARYMKGEMSALMYCQFFAELMSSYLGYTVVYTDGSFVHGAPCWALNSTPYRPLSTMGVSHSLHRLLEFFTELPQLHT